MYCISHYVVHVIMQGMEWEERIVIRKKKKVKEKWNKQIGSEGSDSEKEHNSKYLK